jgi:hypothetical protein
MAAPDETSDGRMAWVTHEGKDAIFFGKHPWRLVNRLDDAEAYADGAGGLMVDLLAFVIGKLAPPARAGQSPGQLRVEWVYGGGRDPENQTGAFMVFLPPTLANIARYWRVTEPEAQTALIVHMGELIRGMAVRQFGEAVFSEWRHYAHEIRLRASSTDGQRLNARIKSPCFKYPRGRGGRQPPPVTPCRRQTLPSCHRN